PVARLHVHATPPLLCLSYFPLVLPPPAPSTLFPYTTLFRSSSRRPVTTRGALIVVPRRSRPWRPNRRLGGRRAHRGQFQRSAGRDRKSTRLNSSHVSISYAVFCLKKKREAHGSGRRVRHTIR